MNRRSPRNIWRAALSDLGWQVRVMTRRWDRGWPEQIHMGDYSVSLIAYSSKTLFGVQRQPRLLHQSLESHVGRFDLVIACGSNENTTTVIQFALRHGLPCVWWLVPDGPSPPLAQLARSVKQVNFQPDQFRVVVENPEMTTKLNHCGLVDAAIEVIEPGVHLDRNNPQWDREAARVALPSVDSRMRVTPNQFVASALGPVRSKTDWLKLINAWPMVSAEAPSARLWLFGDGEEFTSLWEHARRNDSTSQISFCGWFDDLDEVFLASDLLIVPDPGVDPRRMVLRAMAMGVPVFFWPAQRAGCRTDGTEPRFRVPAERTGRATYSRRFDRRSKRRSRRRPATTSHAATTCPARQLDLIK